MPLIIYSPISAQHNYNSDYLVIDGYNISYLISIKFYLRY